MRRATLCPKKIAISAALPRINLYFAMLEDGIGYDFAMLEDGNGYAQD